jgi:hypothetical protein
MEQRPYLRALTNLSVPLRAALAFGALAALTWLVAVTLSWGFDLDVDFLSVVLFGAMAAVIFCAGVELNRQEKTWIRVIGVLLVVGVVIAVLLLALTLWYLSLLCENGCN